MAWSWVNLSLLNGILPAYVGSIILVSKIFIQKSTGADSKEHANSTKEASKPRKHQLQASLVHQQQ
jgi:hypothetical protein